MKKSLAVYTISHFVVDFACGYLLSSFVRESEYEAGTIVTAFLLYNCLAFGLQFLFGLFFDGRNHMVCAAAGCLLLVGAYLPGFGILVCAILAGLGNAMFHVGGGIDALVYSGGTMGRSGVFVSSGAAGIALGMLMGAAGSVTRVIPALMVAVCTACIIHWGKPQKKISTHSENNKQPGRLPVLTSTLAVISLCLLSVFIRSWVGTVAKMPWRTGYALVFAAAAASLLGKAMGGFAADRFGARRVGVVSLFLSLMLIGFFRDYILTGLVGLVLFNITMPITLCTIAWCLRGHEGFAFGLTTLALLVGYIIGTYFPVHSMLRNGVLAAGIATSAVCVLLSVADTVRVGIEERSVR